MRAVKVYGNRVFKMYLAVYAEGKLGYRYVYNRGTSSEIPCEFHLLSEVGERWVNGFRRMIANLHLDVEHGYDDGKDIYDRFRPKESK